MIPHVWTPEEPGFSLYLQRMFSGETEQQRYDRLNKLERAIHQGIIRIILWDNGRCP